MAGPSADTILPDPTQLRLITLTTTNRGITAVVATKAAAVPCPGCGQLATRRHSRYTRSVADVPWHGVGMAGPFIASCTSAGSAVTGQKAPATSSPSAFLASSLPLHDAPSG